MVTLQGPSRKAEPFTLGGDTNPSFQILQKIVQMICCQNSHDKCYLFKTVLFQCLVTWRLKQLCPLVIIWIGTECRNVPGVARSRSRARWVSQRAVPWDGRWSPRKDRKWSLHTRPRCASDMRGFNRCHLAQSVWPGDLPQVATALLRNLPKEHNGLTFEELVTRDINIPKSNSAPASSKSSIVTIGKRWESEINSMKLKGPRASTSLLGPGTVTSESIRFEYSSRGGRAGPVPVDRPAHKTESQHLISWIAAIPLSHVRNSMSFPSVWSAISKVAEYPWNHHNAVVWSPSKHVLERDREL